MATRPLRDRLRLGVVGVSVASRRIGEREAITDARSQTLAKAQNLVEPALTEDLLEGDPAAVRRVDGRPRGRSGRHPRGDGGRP